METSKPHSLAIEHLPFFVSGPGETDVLFVVVAVIATTVTMLVGVLYFTLHHLPEKIGSKYNSGQLLLIGILSLIAMFTHNNTFFFAALILAAVQLPDWTTPLTSIAKSLRDLAKKESAE